ncbi:SMP-30/gluconolactonase/LRE family protein [Novosphingobium mathurense]|uniref:Sugar lactone lactonase YvrE n=1 Tax=Novosphingobium mathurense TaxID=428990 RepID=A0A1U6I643_9SPHN|nr:SMP-30/gluconolactonase/LRE family protein [Novosphingobium mathurense]SLK03496.1 Sugar lactone lactonase YvrE [Novosphingobium mathurense]
MAVSGPVSLALDARAMLGEGPVWDTARQCLWFVDIKSHAVWCLDPQSGTSQWIEAPDQVGWVLPTSTGRLLAGLKSGLHLLDPVTRQFEKTATIPGEPAHNRLNDACTDRAGRVWFGSMDDNEEAETGRFYRYERGAIVAAGPAGVTITNGPAVNGRADLVYFSDTLGRRIFVAELGEDGLPGEPRLFVDIAQDFAGAYPDGPVVDAEGCVWTGLWNGWAVARYSPEGRLMETVSLPVANVTKLAFGGADLMTAFVTTARKGLDGAALEAQPQAGGVFTFRSGVAGLATTPVEMT